MLKDDFYTIVEKNKTNAGFSFLVRLNEKHSIYNGHFPGQPVVPGACLLQMLIEFTEVMLERKVKFLQADELKFLVPINPIEDNILHAQVSYITGSEGKINVTAAFSQQSKSPCFKCKTVFGNI